MMSVPLGTFHSGGHHLQACLRGTGVFRRNCNSRHAAAFYSQDVCNKIPIKCPMHTNKLAQQRNKSSMVGAQLDITKNNVQTVKPFDEIPIPGKYEKGLLGVVAPLIHAVRGKAFNKPHEYLISCKKELGPIFRQQTGVGWIVQISDPVDFEKLFRRVGKYPSRPVIQPWIDYRHRNNFAMGLVTSEGEEWQRIRSAVSKGILKPSALVNHVSSMHEVVLELIDKLKTIRRPDEVIPNIEDELYKWAMESSATFFYDKKLNLIQENVLKKENQEFFDALQTLTWETLKVLAIPEHILKLFPRSRNPVLMSNKAWDVLFRQAKTYIDEKRDKLAEKAAKGEDINDGTFIAYLVLQNKLTPAEMYGSVVEIMGGSVDTTSHTSTWAIHLISKKPEVQEKIYQEVQRVNPDRVPATAEMLDNMPYLRAVVKEVQRLFPITLGTARLLEEDIELKGYNVPAGTHISANYYSAGRDPNVFDNPEEFHPERWLNPDKKYHPFASLPFGHGTRICVGRRLAQQEMYLLLSEIVRNFKIVPTKLDVKANCGITIHPETSVEPKLIDRQQR